MITLSPFLPVLLSRGDGICFAEMGDEPAFLHFLYLTIVNHFSWVFILSFWVSQGQQLQGVLQTFYRGVRNLRNDVPGIERIRFLQGLLVLGFQEGGEDHRALFLMTLEKVDSFRDRLEEIKASLTVRF